MPMHRATSDWKSKLHPAFIEIAGAYKEFSLEFAAILKQAKREERALGRNMTLADKQRIAKRIVSQKDELLRRVEKEIIDIDQHHRPLQESSLCYPYLTDLAQPHSSERESRLFVQWLHGERHHESLEKAEEADSHGDLEAYDRLARTGRDARTILHKKGAIKPFQGGIYHRDIFNFGLSFASGLEKLTGEELAEFFDRVCPCGKDHDSRALQKQLARLLKELEGATRKS